MKIESSLVALTLGLMISGCGRETEGPDPAEQTVSLRAEDVAAHVQVLASDEFGGRAPASEGEAKTLEYVSDVFDRLGLRPGNGDSYLQPVPLISVTAEDVSPLVITGGGGSVVLRYQQNMMAGTLRYAESVAIDGSEVVFAGYGIVAPEYGWDDYAGRDVRGKTVVVLVNDPGFATEDPAVFNGRAMTYYGRWTYKYEEAARQGAAAALIVHETEAAGYPWLVVNNSWSGAQFDLQRGEGAPRQLDVMGWLTSEAARKVFRLAGKDFDQLAVTASRSGFEPIDLNVQASLVISNSLSKVESNNLIAWLPGRERPDEYLIYTAHWDHLGTARSVLQDRIYNGAVDNGIGVAGMLEIAEAFTLLEPEPERSVVFLAVTAEESGLLGSAWYASHPLFPLDKTVANINLDAMSLVGPTYDITVIGYGNSELDQWASAVADRQGRRLEREPTPEKGFYYRSDHFNFAKRGVPALYLRGGVEHREKGREYGLAYKLAWTAERYHKVTDEFSTDWDLRGVVEDLELLFGVGKALANSREWPNWVEGNEFRAIRDASSGARTRAENSGTGAAVGQ